MGATKRTLYGLGGLALFIVSLQTLGRATQALTPIIESALRVIIRGDLSALGASWLSAYLFMNGSSVAALSLSLFKSQIINVTELFMAISGSRMGAAFIVVMIGYLQYLQGKNKNLKDSCSIGILSFIVSYITYIPAIVLGLFILSRFNPAGLEISGIRMLQYSITGVLDPVVTWLTRILTRIPAFLLSFAGLFISLKVFDGAFSGISSGRFKNKYFRFIMTHNWISFLFGAFTTLITTSVSISVGLIVPLYNKRYIKRKEIIPYLLGSNITTLGDTALAALVLDTGTGFNVVTVMAAVVSLTSFVALAFYNRFFNLVKWLFDRIVSDRRFMVGFIMALTVIPLVLLAL